MGKRKRNKKLSEKSDSRSPELSDEVVEIEDGVTKRSSKRLEKEILAEPALGKKGKPRKRGVIGFLTSKVSTRKTLIIIGLSLVLALLVIAANLFFSRLGANLRSHYAFPEGEEVLDYPSPLTGVLTTEEKGTRRVIGVMIENHPSSRPQSGLVEAGLVYEATTEGGITRFLVFYLEGDSEKLGPVRSARCYFLSWVKELDTLYGHVGGSPKSMKLIPEYDLKDLDQFYNSQLYWRSKARYAPHNVYSTTENLRRAGVEKGWEDINTFQPWQFQDDTELGEKLVNRITVNFSSQRYMVDYRYDKEENNYQRYLAGVPHKDLEDQWIKPKNVVIQIIDKDVHTKYRPLSSGKAFLFRDGKIFKGEWEKKELEDRTHFYLPDGKEFKFAKGQTWIHILPLANLFSYHRE